MKYEIGRSIEHLKRTCRSRIGQPGQRIQSNVKVQEGDEPKEQPKELMAGLDSCPTQLQQLTWRISATNIETPGSEGKTLTELMGAEECAHHAHQHPSLRIRHDIVGPRPPLAP